MWGLILKITQELAITHAVVSEQVIAPGGMSQQPAQQLQISYFSIDSYSKLVTLMFKVYLMFFFQGGLVLLH